MIGGYIWWQAILLMLLGDIVAKVIRLTLGNGLSKIINLTNFKIMNELYIKMWTEFVAGMLLFGTIFLFPKIGTNLFDMSMGFVYGMLIYGAVFYFTDMRKYNTLQKSLEILEIDTDEKFEKFLKEQGGINE